MILVQNIFIFIFSFLMMLWSTWHYYIISLLWLLIFVTIILLIFFSFSTLIPFLFLFLFFIYIKFFQFRNFSFRYYLGSHCYYSSNIIIINCVSYIFLMKILILCLILKNLNPRNKFFRKTFWNFLLKARFW